MRYFSTFSGIGGFEIGIQNAFTLRVSDAGDPNTKGHQPNDTSDIPQEGGFGPRCVGYSEIDKHAIKVYERHFSHENYGDITKINAEELPDFDCLVGGFPCQAFSIAGKRGGFDDTRGTLFFDLARILRAKQPRLFVFENVKGLLSHDNGRTFKTIIATITELGYDAQWQVLNSKNFGVPQNRERVIIVGHLRGGPRPQVFPIQQSAQDSFGPSTNVKEAIAGTLTARMFANWSGNHIAQLNEPVHSNDHVYSPEGIGPTLNTMQGGRRQPLIALGGNEASDGTKVDTDGVREATGVSRSLDPISDTQRYKMAGNAVTTNVIQAVFERIFATMEW